MDRCLLSFIVGIGISLLLPITNDNLILLSISAWAVLVGYWVPRARAVATAVVAIFCGISVTTATLNWQATQAERLLNSGTKQWLDVTVVEIPQVFSHHTRFIASIEVPQNGFFSAVLAQPKLQLSWYGDDAEQIQLGQRWRAEVALKGFRNYWNEGSRDYLATMQRRGIVARGTVSQGHLLAENNGLRARLVRVFEQRDDGHQGILAALGIGVRELLSAEQQRDWQHNGLTHALAISGLHLSLVGWAGLMIGRVLVARLLGQRCSNAGLEQRSIHPLSLLVALSIAFGYAWLADFSIATLRALIMFAVIVVHRVLALNVSAWQLLLRTVAVLLLLDPLALLDAGFWLSVTALVTIFTTLWRWRSKGAVGKWQGLLRLQGMFLVVMAPLSLHWFGGVSVIAPAINVLVLPVISLWLLPLTLLGVVAELSYAHTFADNLWYLAALPMHVIAPFLSWTAEFSWSWWQPPFKLPLTALLAVMLVVLLPLSQRLLKAVLLLTVPLALSAWQVSRPRADDLYLHVLDVGQSQALVIERAGRAWLVDTAMGYDSGYNLAATVIEPFLQSRQLQLEAVWVSHRDRDHSGGVSYLQRKYPHISWFGALTLTPCEEGMEGRWNQINWKVLWPPRVAPQHTSSNNASCVLWFQYGHFTFLLPGDIEFGAERHIAEANGFRPADVMVAPHHGSKTSSGWLMLKQVRPSLILISNGEHKGFNFPHRYTTQRYRHLQRRWFNTKDHGQLSVVSDGQGWQLLLPMAQKRLRKLYHLGD